MITAVSNRTFLNAALFSVLCAQGMYAQQSPTVRWQAILKQTPAWYASPEALRIADNVLLYQRNSGGWPKNIDMASTVNAEGAAGLLKKKNSNDSTIDNGATHTQLAFLARVYTQQSQPHHREAFLKGLDYLLQAQYANGGWPQFYPDLSGYYRHITFNDGAMIGVMKVLQSVALQKHDYSFVDEVRRQKSAAAVQKGIDCILRTQLLIAGQRTVWCAQVVRGYFVENLHSRKSKHAVDVQGLPNAPITDLLLRNCTFDNVTEGSIVKNVERATSDNVRINGRIVDISNNLKQ